MLQLHAKTININRISKLLVKYRIKARITDQVITLEDDVSAELLNQICSNTEIYAVQNFIGEEGLKSSDEAKSIQSEEKSQIYELIYPEVKRGQIYLCDFGEPYGHEQGFERPAIIIQNDNGNVSSPTTIVIPCTTKHKHYIHTHRELIVSPENMVDFDLAKNTIRDGLIMAEHIYTVDKRRLRKYLGILTSEFMEGLQDNIDIALSLNRDVKTVIQKEEVKVYVDRPVPQKVAEDSTGAKEHRDLNMTQVQLLALVDIQKLLTISKSISTDEVKARQILELFGFDCTKNGIQYLLKAILVSPKNAYFNLETLSENVSKEEHIDKEEIKRLIVARVKETFGFKKAPTIDFIRLVSSFLTK